MLTNYYNIFIFYSVTRVGIDIFYNIFTGIRTQSGSMSVEQPITVLNELSTLFYRIFYLMKPVFLSILDLKPFLFIDFLGSFVIPNISLMVVYIWA